MTVKHASKMHHQGYDREESDRMNSVAGRVLNLQEGSENTKSEG